MSRRRRRRRKALRMMTMRICRGSAEGWGEASLPDAPSAVPDDSGGSLRTLPHYFSSLTEGTPSSTTLGTPGPPAALSGGVVPGGH